jgi:hypothetical protein
VIRPIEPPSKLVNHRFPSAPAAMPPGMSMLRPVTSVTFPRVVIRPIVLSPPLTNHSALSGPDVIPWGWEMPLPGNSLSRVRRPALRPAVLRPPVLRPPVLRWPGGRQENGCHPYNVYGPDAIAPGAANSIWFTGGASTVGMLSQIG